MFFQIQDWFPRCASRQQGRPFIDPPGNLHGMSALRRFGLSAPLVVVLAAAFLAAPAQADQKQIDKAEAQVAALQEQAEAAAEDHHEARVRLLAIEKDISTISARLDKTKTALGTATKTINSVAVAAWVNGGVDPSLQLLMAPDADVFLTTASALDQVARNQNAVLRQATALRLTLQQDQVQLAARKAAAAAAVKEMATHMATTKTKLAAAEKVLSQLKAAERKAYEARLKAKKAAAAATAKQAKAAALASATKASARVQKVLTYALAQVGDPYVIAADGDNSFDCSGLVLASYKRAGISLPHSSRTQFKVTKRVSKSDLRAGDLVFFFRRGAAHVGIYIGNNKFVHASNPREDVRITSLNDPWYSARYSGAGRVVS